MRAVRRVIRASESSYCAGRVRADGEIRTEKKGQVGGRDWFLFVLLTASTPVASGCEASKSIFFWTYIFFWINNGPLDAAHELLQHAQLISLRRQPRVLVALEQRLAQPALHARIPQQWRGRPSEEIRLEELEVLPAENEQLRIHSEAR